jgi:hypothetical protein
MTRLQTGALTTLSLAGAAVLVARRLGRRWGATEAEARGTLPGDELVPRPDWETTHAVSIEATPADIWPWLVQMGFGRGGWYVSERLDRVVWRVKNASVDRIVPELQHLAVGDVVPDSANGATYFRVEAIEPERAIVLRSTRHPIKGGAIDPTVPKPGPYLDFTWVFAVEPIAEGESRLFLRARANARPRWLMLGVPLFDVADFVYARQILFGIKRRVERAASRSPGVSIPTQREGATGWAA